MKKFLNKILIFWAIIALMVVVSLLLPATPKSSNNYIFSKTNKDSLLQTINSPRIIIIGGSNIVYGLNSQIIKDSLGLNPINAGLSATVGLIYMMENTLNYVKPRDIVVVVPEYQQFFGNFAYGAQDLLRLLVDVDPSGFSNLQLRQWINIIKKSPDYFVSKFNPKQYFFFDVNPVYGRNIFNEYGDSNFHWKLEPIKFEPYNFNEKQLNYSVFNAIDDFNRKLIERGAVLFVTFPCFQTTSYNINEEAIIQVEKEFMNRDLIVLGSSERYMMPDSLMFDTPYHLTLEGVNLRTN